MVIRVPASVDVDALISGMQLSKTKKKNLKEKIYYFLSLIAQDNDNYQLYKNTNGFVKLCSRLLKRKLGDRLSYEIIHILTSGNEPIVESDESWHHSLKSKSKSYCKGYRVTKKYRTGELICKTVSEKYNEKLKCNYKNDDISNINFNFLKAEIENNDLSFDNRVFDCIMEYGKELMNGINKENKYQKELVYNKVGRLINIVNNFKNSLNNSGISSSNNRFNSVITSIRRIIRPYLICNDEELHELDIKSSQPYILSTILNNNFISDTSEGYNLHTIYNELYKYLIEIGKIEQLDNKINSDIIISNNLFNISNIHNASFMWCIFLDEYEWKSIELFNNTDFTSDFYAECIERAKYQTDIISPSQIPNRGDFKKSMMFILFEKNKGHRQKNNNILLFHHLYPGVDRFIREMHDIIGPDKFALLLQRVESYLILDKVCRQFKDSFPDAPIFTIHDAMLTNQKYLPDLCSQTQDTIQKITGKAVGIKIKQPDLSGIPCPVEIRRDLDDIRTVENQKQFDKVSGDVFAINVQKGKDFLGI